MSTGWLLVLLAAAFVFRSTILQALGLHGAYLNLDIVILTVAAVMRGPWFSAGLAVFTGFLEDLTLGRWLGLHAGWLGLVIFAAGWAARPLFRKSLLLHVVAVVGTTGLYEGGLYGLGRLLGDSPIVPRLVMEQLLLAMFWNGLMTLLAYPLWRRLVTPPREDFMQSTPK
ncbi:MAG: rod shape-determining protein MreD [Alicyclobacillaceae bacterium]|nr:rod shape-determining protein MreD [Alicyclobacillaceae bacterium]